jgi:hypothetical protein
MSSPDERQGDQRAISYCYTCSAMPDRGLGPLEVKTQIEVAEIQILPESPSEARAAQIEVARAQLISAATVVVPGGTDRKGGGCET